MLETLIGLMQEHGLKAALSLGFLILGTWWGKRRARAEWERKEFLGRLNVSLNLFVDGKLIIRTVLEDSLEAVFLNRIAVDQVLEAARKTTPDDSLLPLAKDDAWYFLNSVLNVISERFAEGHFRRDMGLPVTTRRYLICLTNEAAGEMRQRKIRAMVIHKDALLHLPPELPALESQSHTTRYATLKQLAAAYPKHPEYFLEVDVTM